jgi:hypothetical protein
MPATYNFQVSLRLSRCLLEHHEVRLKGGRIVLLVGTSLSPALIGCLESSKLSTAHFDGDLYMMVREK